MVLVNKISAIMMQYMTAYIEMCYQVNTLGTQFSVLY